MRSHGFEHGGGSVRLFDFISFIDVKFVRGASLRFASVRGQMRTWIRISGFKVLKIGSGYRRFAAPGAQYELVADDALVEIFFLGVGQCSQIASDCIVMD